MPFSTSSMRTSLPNSLGLCAFPLRITNDLCNADDYFCVRESIAHASFSHCTLASVSFEEPDVTSYRPFIVPRFGRVTEFLRPNFRITSGYAVHPEPLVCETPSYLTHS